MKSRRTFKYRLYRNKKNKHLEQQIDISGIIWNHLVALQRRYYKLTGKYISRYDLMRHITKLKKLPKYAFWNLVGSQAIQDIVERLDKSYREFFKSRQGKTNRKVGRPSFKKVKKYKSFTLKQAGWKLLGGNKILIQGKVYKFSKSREIKGEIKTVTVKRDQRGNFWICFSVEIEIEPAVVDVTTGNMAGFDFGLKTFLTGTSKDLDVVAPEFFKRSLNEIAAKNRALSRKQDGSGNRKKAKDQLNKAHEKITNQRRDWQFKTAHELTDKLDVIFLEDLNIDGMKRLWGRKVSDLGFSSFVRTLEYVAGTKGKVVHFVDRFYPSSKICADCRHIKRDLQLGDRIWLCPHCGITHHRDRNAALNIEREGASSLRLEDVRRVTLPAVLV